MIKNRKNKIILGVLAGAAVISLASVGFAQWQIGLVQNEANNSIDVAVDTFAEDTCYLNVATVENAKIKLGELAASDKGNGVGYVEETEKASLEVEITDFTLAISKINKTKTPSLTFKLSVENESAGKSLTTTIGAVDIFGRTAGSATFIGLEQTITLDNFENPTCFTVDEKSVEGYSIYKLNNKFNKFKFNWGSVFGNADGKDGLIQSGRNTPASYYQAKINSVTGETEEALKNKLKMLNQVQKDLTAMHTALDGAKLKLTINFGFSK